MPKTRANKAAKTCPECGGGMVYETREDHVEYKGQRRAFRFAAWWCTRCGESIHEGAALQTAERAFVELRAEVDRILLPEEVAAVRKSLNLSQRAASRRLGGGPRAFQKYESGAVPVSEPMKNLLLLLRNDPTRLAELEGGRPVTKATRVAPRPMPRRRRARTIG